MSGKIRKLSLYCDGVAVQQLLADFSQRSFESRCALADAIEKLGDSAFSARIDLDVGTEDALQHRLVLVPSKLLLDLVAALRAGDVDGGVVQQSIHG